MLSDESLLNKFSEHLKHQLKLIEKEVARNAGTDLETLSHFYLSRQHTLIDLWENRIHRNLLAEFLELEKDLLASRSLCFEILRHCNFVAMLRMTE